MAGSSRNVKIAGITFSIPVETTDIQTFEGGELIKEYIVITDGEDYLYLCSSEW